MVFLNVVLPVFLIIALGFGIRRINFVDKFFLDKISHLAYFVAVPALLVWKIGTSSFDLNFNPRLILGCYLTVIGCGLGAYGFARLLRLPSREVGSFTQGSFWGNLTYIGLPIILAAYGEEGLQRGGVLIGFMSPLVNAAAVLALIWPLKSFFLSSGSDQEKPIKFDQMYPNNRHFEGLKRHFQPPNQA